MESSEESRQEQMSKIKNSLFIISQKLQKFTKNNSNTSKCQELKIFISGSSNIPLIVYIILILSCVSVTFSFLYQFINFRPFKLLSNITNFIFIIFVWCPLATKIEKYTSTVRYGIFFLLNYIILCLINISFPLNLCNLWRFTLFETILIASSNQDKTIRFFGVQLNGRNLINISILYEIICNSVDSIIFPFISVILIIIYTLCYKLILIKKFEISNDIIKRLEDLKEINLIKNKIKSFVTIEQALDKEKNLLIFNNICNNCNNNNFNHFNIYQNIDSENENDTNNS